MTSIVAPIGPIDITPPGAGGGDPTVDTPYVPFTVPVGDDGYVPTELVTPFVDPFQHTFRATSVADMFRIVPDMGLYWNDLEVDGDTGIASFKFDIGVASKICPLYVTFQNRTVSHNLWIQLELPSYLRQDPGPPGRNNDLGNEFLVPHRGNTQTPPVSIRPGITRAGSYGTDTDRFTINALTIIGSLPTVEWRDTGTGTGKQPVPDDYWTGTGKGIINIKLIFDDAKANLLMPGNLQDEIIVKVTPMYVNSPVYVDKYAARPNDLNTLIKCRFDEPPPDVPRDDDTPNDPDDPTCEPEPIIEYVEIEKEVFLEDDTPRYWDGTTGELVDGVPPVDWYAGSDGRMYPPIVDADPCTDGLGTNPIDEFEQLIIDSVHVAPSFGDATRRKVYVVNVQPYVSGEKSTFIQATTLHMVVGDSVPGQPLFKLLKSPFKTTYRDGEPIPSSDEFWDYFNATSAAIPAAKEGKEGCSVNPLNNSLQQIEECVMYKLAKTDIPALDASTSDRAGLNNLRVVVTGADILDTMWEEGEGVSKAEWDAIAQEIIDRRAEEFWNNQASGSTGN